MIDPARLTPLDHLRLLEEVAENVAWRALMADYRAGYSVMALHGDTAEAREIARQKYLAADDIEAALRAAMAGARAEHERQMAELKDAGA